MTRIALRGVHKRFGPKVVLDGVDLDIAAGKSLVVIGGSGTGKSVLIKSILGLLRVDAGSIVVDGAEVTALRGAALAAHQAKFGMLFQGGALFDSLSVWHNVAFALPRRDGAARRVPPRSTTLPASGSAPKSPTCARRNCRAACRSASRWPAPSPSTGDHLLRRADDGPRPDHGRRHQRPDRQPGPRPEDPTALTITHDMASARKIADRIAMLYAGRIIWQGPRAMIDVSSNAYVDQFVHGRAEGPIQMQPGRA